MDQSLEDGRPELARLFSQYELADLESDQFQRLLKRAHAEGRLAAMLPADGNSGSLGPRQTAALDPGSSPENPAIQSERPRHPRITTESWSLKRWFRSISWLIPPVKP
jgi:hypothetical protein